MSSRKRSLDGTRIVVTGAAGAFGTAITQHLESRGARVAGLDRHPRDTIIGCDITDSEAVDAAIAEAAERLGGIDVLVNNAGIGTGATVAQGWGDPEREVLDVNVGGAWRVTAAALPHLIGARGHVVNVASLLAVVSMPYASAYAASKRALCAFSDALRLEQQGVVAVTTVYPGYAKTPIHTPAEQRSGRSLEGLTREETPADVARAVESAIRRRPRDQATTRYGALVFRLARMAPGLLDAVVARMVARQERRVKRRESVGTR